MQGYNVDIGHIPRKKNPADSLSHQLIADALVRKGSVKDANTKYVQKPRVSSIALTKKYRVHYMSYSKQALKALKTIKAVRALKAIQLFQIKALKAQFCQRMKVQALKAQIQDLKC